jgi:hypothetical protein
LYFVFCIFIQTIEAETGESYVASLPWLSCSSEEWLQLRDLAIGGLAVYALGVPALFAGLYFYFLRKKRLYEPDVQYSIGFFYSSYKQHVWYAARLESPPKTGPHREECTKWQV